MGATDRIAGVVLASGLSSRFGSENKLLARLHGTEIVRLTVAAYLEARLDGVWVVVGHDAEAVEAALQGLAVTIVYNPDYREGQSRALVRAVQALPPVRAAVIGVGDQPRLSAGVVDRLVDVYRRLQPPIVAPLYSGTRGNPVLFGRELFPELLSVSGDQGGRPVIARHRADVTWVEMGDEGEGVDVDTLEDLRRVAELPPTRES